MFQLDPVYRFSPKVFQYIQSPKHSQLFQSFLMINTIFSIILSSSQTNKAFTNCLKRSRKPKIHWHIFLLKFYSAIFLSFLNPCFCRSITNKQKLSSKSIEFSRRLKMTKVEKFFFSLKMSCVCMCVHERGREIQRGERESLKPIRNFHLNFFTFSSYFTIPSIQN